MPGAICLASLVAVADTVSDVSNERIGSDHGGRRFERRERAEERDDADVRIGLRRNERIGGPLNSILHENSEYDYHPLDRDRANPC